MKHDWARRRLLVLRQHSHELTVCLHQPLQYNLPIYLSEAISSFFKTILKSQGRLNKILLFLMRMYGNCRRDSLIIVQSRLLPDISTAAAIATFACCRRYFHKIPVYEFLPAADVIFTKFQSMNFYLTPQFHKIWPQAQSCSHSDFFMFFTVLLFIFTLT